MHGQPAFLHQDLRGLGWTTAADVGQALLIGQVGPGPKGLWVIGLGYLTGGYLGVLGAVLVIAFPSLLALVIEARYHHLAARPWVHQMMYGISLAVGGWLLIVCWFLLGGTTLDGRKWLIGVVTFGLGLSGRIPHGRRIAGPAQTLAGRWRGAMDAESARGWMTEGWARLKERSYDDALEALNWVLTLEPGNVKAWRFKAEALEGLKRYQVGLARCVQAITLDPAFAPACSEQAFTLDHLHRRREALEVTGRAIALAPTDLDGFSARGDTLLSSDRDSVIFLVPGAAGLGAVFFAPHPTAALPEASEEQR